VKHKMYDDERLDVCMECGTRSVEHNTCLNCGEAKEAEKNGKEML